jgi:hypothetical protein
MFSSANYPREHLTGREHWIPVTSARRGGLVGFEAASFCGEWACLPRAEFRYIIKSQTFLAATPVHTELDLDDPVPQMKIAEAHGTQW